MHTRVSCFSFYYVNSHVFSLPFFGPKTSGAKGVNNKGDGAKMERWDIYTGDRQSVWWHPAP